MTAPEVSPFDLHATLPASDVSADIGGEHPGHVAAPATGLRRHSLHA